MKRKIEIVCFIGMILTASLGGFIIGKAIELPLSIPIAFGFGMINGWVWVKIANYIINNKC